MSPFMIEFRINEVQRNLNHATDSAEIEKLEADLQGWKRHLHEAKMIEFEERVGFKSMERNAGVWDER